MNVRLAACIAYAGALFGASAVPGEALPDLTRIGTAVHAAAYAGFGALLFRWRATPPARTAPAFLWAVVLASLYGLADEWHQVFVPGRTPDPMDWVADTAGAALGALVLVAWRLARAAGRVT
ncbi:VanZ family protein [Dissulfurirhabdus thermomarina]|nr:VanZ family protein [Dissulfurirhabdus thermomarina]